MSNPNILLILVDALRARSLGCYGYGKKISPAIDRLAERGVLFENCFTCTNASDPALTSVMSGMLTHSHGIFHHSFEVNDEELAVFEARKVRLLQEILRENGYHTYGLDFMARWHCRGYDYYPPLKIDRTKRKKLLNRLSRLFGTVGLKSWFKKVHATKTMRRLFGGFDSYPKDGESFQKALEIVSQKKEPYFLFVHLWGAHKPYACPQVINKSSVECYDEAVGIVDRHIGQLIEAAGRETLVVVLGDHGESMGEHGIWFDHHGLYDPTLHVPLIFSGANVPSGSRIRGLVSITDVFATVLSLIKIDYAAKTDSLDLCPYFENEGESIRDAVFAEENYYQDNICIRTKHYKLIKNTGRKKCELCHAKHGADVQLYDLTEDKFEMRNIASSRPDLVASLEKKMDSMRRVVNPAPLPGSGLLKKSLAH